jgi:putative oxidoreductase
MNTLTHRSTIDAGRSVPALAAVLATEPDWTYTLVRATTAAVLFPHGAQHLLGWFGGAGFAGTVGWMVDTLGIPAPLAAFSILLEFFGPLALLAGVLTRPASAALAGFMTVAGSTHVHNGFFMNWVGALPAGVEGFEFHLLVVALCAVTAVKGGGALSVDGLLFPSFTSSRNAL